MSQHVALARPIARLFLSAYLGYFVLSEPGQRQLKEGAYGGTKLQLSLEDIRALIVLRPPLDEQQKIVELLDAALQKMDQLRALAKAAIDILRERRAALISAAVTGKIDVRGL